LGIALGNGQFSRTGHHASPEQPHTLHALTGHNRDPVAATVGKFSKPAAVCEVGP
jgi:hypothetical protein